MPVSDEMIDEVLVRHIADLSRLTLSDEGVASMSRELSAILGYVRKLAEPVTDGVPPTEHASAVKNVFRDDQVRPSIGADASLQNAPQHAGAFFQVPKVLDAEGGV